MDLEIIIVSEVSHTDKDKYHMILLICGLFKNDTSCNEVDGVRVCHTE